MIPIREGGRAVFRAHRTDRLRKVVGQVGGGLSRGGAAIRVIGVKLPRKPRRSKRHDGATVAS